MEFNETKYDLYSYNLNDRFDVVVAIYLPFQNLDINVGVKYMGLYLNQTNI
jgi:hypothetical protein